jgi:hypothetical protein
MNSHTAEIKVVKIQYLSYQEWCKKERLPQDECSLAVYKHWKRSIPKLQGILDDIANGHLHKAHESLGNYLVAFRPERFKVEPVKSFLKD